MIYFLRHGEDDESYVGGWGPTDLTVKGIQQTNEIATFIKNSNFNIKNIYCSDIKRAITTAKIVAPSLNITPFYTEKLREQDKGALTGQLVSLAKIKYPRYFSDIDIHTKYPGGESLYDLYNRMKLLLNKLLKMDDALLITHRGVINMMYFLLNNLEPNMDKKQFGVTHASLHELNPQNKLIRKIR